MNYNTVTCFGVIIVLILSSFSVVIAAEPTAKKIVDVSGLSLLIKNFSSDSSEKIDEITPQTVAKLLHCEPYKLRFEVKFNNPEVHKEAREQSAEWNLEGNAFLKNVITQKDEWQDTNKKHFGILMKKIRFAKPKKDPNWYAVWEAYKYRRTVATTIPRKTYVGDGADNLLIYSHFERATFFKSPGQWTIEFNAHMKVSDLNNPDVTYAALARNKFFANINPPKLHVYAVEGCGGAIVPSENWLLNPFNIEKLKEILKRSDVDHLNKEIVQQLKNFQGTEWRYNHLYRELNILKPIMDSIENGIYFDSDCGCNKIALLGYSYGGHEVLKTAVKMRDGFTPTFTKISEHFGKVFPNRKIDVDLMITIDPVEQFVPPSGNYNAEMFKQHSNVKRHINFYQQVDEGSLMIPPKRIKIQGGSINGIPPELNKKVDRAEFIQHCKGMGWIKDGEDIPAGKLTSHIFMPYLQEVRSRIETEIKKMIPK